MPIKFLRVVSRNLVAVAGISALLAFFATRHGIVLTGPQQVWAQETASPPVSTSNLRLREGTQLTDVVGQFRLTGDRAAFMPLDGSGKFLALENLTLDRVTQVIAEDPNPLEWVVSGTVTEFKGGNYLLVSRAILKSKSTTKNSLFGSR